MDLGSDAAREWAERETQRIVSEFKLNYFKHDYSPIVTKCEQSNHRHRYGVDVSYWSTMGYYQVQEKLIQKFPDLALEGCSGGGHIKDFGVHSPRTLYRHHRYALCAAGSPELVRFDIRAAARGFASLHLRESVQPRCRPAAILFVAVGDDGRLAD